MSVIEVIRSKDFDKFKSLFESNEFKSSDLLRLAIEFGNLNQVKYLLENGVKYESRYVLYHAVKNEHYDIVKFFVENGVSYSALNNALLSSASTGNYTIINFLVENGADVNFYQSLRRCCKNNDVLNHFVSLGYRY